MANLYPNPPIHPQTTCFGVVFGVLWSTGVLFWYENEGYGADIEDLGLIWEFYSILFLCFMGSIQGKLSLYMCWVN